MAKAAWCTVNPMKGKGNASLDITAGAHTGRTARSTTVTVANQTGAKPSKSIAVSQAGKALFITKVTGPTPASLSAAGGVIVVTGKSNAKMINLVESLDRVSAHEFKVNGIVQTDSNGDFTNPQFIIAGDPGATGEYTFESKVTIPPNIFAESLQIEIVYKGCITTIDEASAPTFTIALTQAGATSTISTDKASLSLVAAGTAQRVAVTSNDNWVIS